MTMKQMRVLAEALAWKILPENHDSADEVRNLADNFDFVIEDAEHNKKEFGLRVEDDNRTIVLYPTNFLQSFKKELP